MLSAKKKKSVKVLWLPEGSQTTLKFCLRDRCVVTTWARRPFLLKGENALFAIAVKFSGISYTKQRKALRGCRRLMWFVYVEPNWVWASTETHDPIVTSWCLDSNFETRDLRNQLKSELLRAHEPGCPLSCGKTLSKQWDRSTRKKVGGHRKDSDSYHFTKHLFFKKCYGFLRSKTERQVLY